MVTTQDFVRGIDLGIQPSIVTCNQVVDNATPKQVTGDNGSRGLNLTTTDTAGVPNVPNPDDALNGVTRWKNYIWKRILEDGTIRVYAWNPGAASDAVLLRWQRIDAQDIPDPEIPTILTGNTNFTPANLVRTELANMLRSEGKLITDIVIETNGTIINAKAYGAIGDGTVHLVREWTDRSVYPNLPYSTLADVQVDYPWVTDLDLDTIDFAAIQKAFDVAWQNVKATYGVNPNHTSSLNKSSTALSPCVYLPSGDYHINRTIVIPPKVCFKGQGYRQAIITHSGVGDSKWTNMVQGAGTVKECPIPSGGLYAAFLIRVAADNRWDHITDNLDHTAQPFLSDYASLHCIYGYGATYSGLLIYSSVAGHATIFYSPSPSGATFDTHMFEQLYLSGYGKSGSYKRYGIVCSVGTGTFGASTVDNKGAMQNVTIRDCTIEYIDYPVYAELAGNLRIYGNSISDTDGVVFSFGALTQSGIFQNAIFCGSPYNTGAPISTFMNANCYFVTVEGNYIHYTDQLFIGCAAGLNFSNNTVQFITPAAANNGYVLTLYPFGAAARTALVPTLSAYDISRVNSAGNVFAGNSFNYYLGGPYTGAVPTSGTRYKFFAAVDDAHATRCLIQGNNFESAVDNLVSAAGVADYTLDTSYGNYYHIDWPDINFKLRRVDTADTTGVHYTILKAFGKLYKMYATEFTDPVAQAKTVFLNFQYALSDVNEAFANYEGEHFEVALSRTAAGATTAISVATEDSLGVPSNRVLQDDGSLGASKTLTSGLVNTANAGYSFEVSLVKVGATLAVKVK